MDGRRPAQAGAQNPAYRPARPLPALQGQARIGCPFFASKCRFLGIDIEHSTLVLA
jgi:hypothetical protein